MKIAVSGLGRMGAQIARKLAEGGHFVIAHNRSPGPIKEAEKHGALAAYHKDEVAELFHKQPAIIWMMLPNEIVMAELGQWIKLLPPGSILIDGGNSDFRQTKKHAEAVKQAGFYLVDVGVSGGVWGYDNGFSMMAGGEATAFDAIKPALKTLADPKGGYHYFGVSGSGHFVKMVHNAIEYGMMESLAEGYRMLKEGPFDQIDLAAAGEVWQKSSVVTSWLNQLAAEALRESPELSDISGVVAESGEARWTLQTAQQMGIGMTAIQAAFDVRLASQTGEVNFATKLLAAIRHKFGGHDLNPGK